MNRETEDEEEEEKRNAHICNALIVSKAGNGAG
jgi:hypothetical protein